MAPRVPPTGQPTFDPSFEPSFEPSFTTSFETISAAVVPGWVDDENGAGVVNTNVMAFVKAAACFDVKAAGVPDADADADVEDGAGVGACGVVPGWVDDDVIDCFGKFSKNFTSSK